MSFPYNQVYVITGSSGSGKTAACKFLDKLGAYIVSADEIAKKVVEKGSTGLKAVIETFGKDFLTDQGTLDRKMLHDEITSNKNKKETLERLLHPIIAEEAKKTFEDLIHQGHKPVVYDCPLYFEKNLDALSYKKSILITASDEVKIERLKIRDGLPKESIIHRLKMQLPDELKKGRANITIENNGTLAELEEKMAELFKTLT